MGILAWLRNSSDRRRPSERGRRPGALGLRSVIGKSSLEDLEGRLLLSGFPDILPVADSAAAEVLTEATPEPAMQAVSDYGQLPLSFEPNEGQTDTRVDFLARGPGYGVFLTPRQAVLSLNQATAVRMKVVGGNPDASPMGLDLQANYSNYLIGNDPAQWHNDVPNYGQVRYDEVYQGIDLVYHGSQSQLEYDFVVQPGSEPRTIKLNFGGVKGLKLDRAGNLVLQTAGGELVQHAPVSYQVIDGVRHEVKSRFVVGPSETVGFQIGRYDRHHELTIDPTLSYSAILAGRGYDTGDGITVDSTGAVYVTGGTASTDFPVVNGYQRKIAATNSYDVFISKLSPDGSSLVYSTFLGGRSDDEGHTIALDDLRAGKNFFDRLPCHVECRAAIVWRQRGSLLGQAQPRGQCTAILHLPWG